MGLRGPSGLRLVGVGVLVLLGGLLDSLRERHPDMDPAGIEDIVLGCVTPVGDQMSASAGAVMEGPSWRFGRWGCVVRQDSGW
jgi:acetyl-CoA acetyltransferase